MERTKVGDIGDCFDMKAMRDKRGCFPAVEMLTLMLSTPKDVWSSGYVLVASTLSGPIVKGAQDVRTALQK